MHDNCFLVRKSPKNYFKFFKYAANSFDTICVKNRSFMFHLL